MIYSSHSNKAAKHKMQGMSPAPQGHSLSQAIRGPILGTESSRGNKSGKKVLVESSGRMSQAGVGPWGRVFQKKRIGATKVKRKRKERRHDAWLDHAPELGPFTPFIYNQEGYLYMLSFQFSLVFLCFSNGLNSASYLLFIAPCLGLRGDGSLILRNFFLPTSISWYAQIILRFLQSGHH
jgi:hypothetical protein